MNDDIRSNVCESCKELRSGLVKQFLRQSKIHFVFYQAYTSYALEMSYKNGYPLTNDIGLE